MPLHRPTVRPSVRRGLAVALIATSALSVAWPGAPAARAGAGTSGATARADGPTPHCDRSTCTVRLEREGAQTFTTPAGVRTLTFSLTGGAGGDAAYSDGSVLMAAALGGRSTATVATSAGETFDLVIGGAGERVTASSDDVPQGGAGGVGGGGTGGAGEAGGAGGGGGTFLFSGGTLLLAAGGGGGGTLRVQGGAGGAAGAPARPGADSRQGAGGGGAGTSTENGRGGVTGPDELGTEVTPGSDGTGTVSGPASLPSAGRGGDGVGPGGGGGGGVFAGGGGGGAAFCCLANGAGGGGGAGYAAPGLSDVTGQAGVAGGDGSATITWPALRTGIDTVRLARARPDVGDVQRLVATGLRPGVPFKVKDDRHRVSPRGATSSGRGRISLSWPVALPYFRHEVVLLVGTTRVRLTYRVAKRP